MLFLSARNFSVDKKLVLSREHQKKFFICNNYFFRQVQQIFSLCWKTILGGNFFVWVHQVTTEKRHKHFFIWKNVSWVSVRNFFFGCKKIGRNFFFLFLSATVGCIVGYYNPPYGKHWGKTVFLTSCSWKMDFANLHVILLLKVWIFSILKNGFCECLCLLIFSQWIDQ